MWRETFTGEQASNWIYGGNFFPHWFMGIPILTQKHFRQELFKRNRLIIGGLHVLCRIWFSYWDWLTGSKFSRSPLIWLRYLVQVIVSRLFCGQQIASAFVTGISLLSCSINGGWIVQYCERCKVIVNFRSNLYGRFFLEIGSKVLWSLLPFSVQC